MISKVVHIARREYFQVAQAKSFWFTLLILPLLLVMAPLGLKLMDQDSGSKVMLLDRSEGGDGKAIAGALDLLQHREELNALARYVDRRGLSASDQSATWAIRKRWYSDVEVQQFMARGGLNAALASIQRYSPGAADSFDRPQRNYELVYAPASLVSLDRAALEQRIAAIVQDDDRALGADYVVVIPSDFPRNQAVWIWSDGAPSARLVSIVDQALSARMQENFSAALGIDGNTIVAISNLRPSIEVRNSAVGQGKELNLVRSILPLTCVYVLMMAIMLSGSWSLQSTVEERSGKLIESILASVTPNEFLQGKLLGSMAIGLTMIAVWSACAVVAAISATGEAAELIRPALEAINAPWALMTIGYFSIVGFGMVSLAFIVVGGRCDTMQEAQGYLAPLMIALFVPVGLLIQASILNPASQLVQVLTWIPVYTPFAVIARIGTGISAYEMVGSGVLLAAFWVCQFITLSRLFARDLLGCGASSTRRRSPFPFSKRQ